MRYRLLVFDWDGTLMDSTGAIVRAALNAIEELALPPRPPERIREIIGLGLAESWQTLFPETEGADLGDFVATYRKHFFAAEQQTSRLYPGVRGLLRELAQTELALAVATGKSRRGLDRDFERTGVGDLFGASCTSDESKSKPSPDMLLAIMQRVGVAADETLMIGDTDYDLEMARRASVDALAVTWGAHDRQRLSESLPLTCLDNLAEMTSWLKAAR